jgi:hypothetical protein
MIRPRRRAFMAILAVAVFVSACAPKTASTDPQAQVLVVLLPDTDTGNVGRVVVSNQAGQTELSTAYASTRVTTSRRTPSARTLKENDVMRHRSISCCSSGSTPRSSPTRVARSSRTC